MSFKNNIKVNSPNVQYTDDEYLLVDYEYLNTKVRKVGDIINVSETQ